MAHIALVEDDSQIRMALQIGLKTKGVRVSCFASAEEFLSDPSAVARFDLVLVDLGLPGKSGFELCERVRKLDRMKPVLIITANSSEENAVLAFHYGADDFVRKPFGIEELFARIQRLLGRALTVKKLIRFEGLVLNTGTRSAHYLQQPLELTIKESTILSLLMQRAGEAVPRETLINAIDTDVEINDRTLDSHISHIRTKLKDAGAASIRIAAVYGLGYRIERTD